MARSSRRRQARLVGQAARPQGVIDVLLPDLTPLRIARHLLRREIGDTGRGIGLVLGIPHSSVERALGRCCGVVAAHSVGRARLRRVRQTQFAKLVLHPIFEAEKAFTAALAKAIEEAAGVRLATVVAFASDPEDREAVGLRQARDFVVLCLTARTASHAVAQSSLNDHYADLCRDYGIDRVVVWRAGDFVQRLRSADRLARCAWVSGYTITGKSLQEIVSDV